MLNVTKNIIPMHPLPSHPSHQSLCLSHTHSAHILPVFVVVFPILALNFQINSLSCIIKGFLQKHNQHQPRTDQSKPICIHHMVTPSLKHKHSGFYIHVIHTLFLLYTWVALCWWHRLNIPQGRHLKQLVTCLFYAYKEFRLAVSLKKMQVMARGKDHPPKHRHRWVQPTIILYSSEASTNYMRHERKLPPEVPAVHSVDSKTKKSAQFRGPEIHKHGQHVCPSLWVAPSLSWPHQSNGTWLHPWRTWRVDEGLATKQDQAPMAAL